MTLPGSCQENALLRSSAIEMSAMQSLQDDVTYSPLNFVIVNNEFFLQDFDSI